MKSYTKKIISKPRIGTLRVKWLEELEQEKGLSHY